MTIAKKLAEARTKIGVKKTGKNAFAKYNYYQIDEIYAEAKSVFNDLGIMTVERSDVFSVEGKIYMKFSLDVINTDDVNDKLTFESITEPNTMKGAQPAQEAGSTITYMTKYLYGLALMIDDGKTDPDLNNDHKDVAPKKTLSRSEIIERVKNLPEKELSEYVNEYNTGNVRKVTDPTYWRQDFLNQIAGEKGWIK